MTKQEIDTLVTQILGCAIEVHKELGPGLLESVYHKCLKIALEEKGFSVESEVWLPVYFTDIKLPMKVTELIYWWKTQSFWN